MAAVSPEAATWGPGEAANFWTLVKYLHEISVIKNRVKEGTRELDTRNWKV